MKLLDNLKSIIVEASKKKILIDKIGLSEENAETIDRIAGPLSVWLINKFIDNSMKHQGKSKEEIVNRMNTLSISSVFNNLTSIMDWIRVGLNGNVKPFMDLSFKELYRKSKEWHDSLDVGQGDINYIENNPVILDFRDQNGNGFYWANLETSNSPEECERMGHCGRSSYGDIYSLREVKPLNSKFKLNKSHLTASIGSDGTMYQLKGPKNSKPQSKFHPYIIDLLYLKDEDGEYFIQNFGKEYDSPSDFKITDLPKEQIMKLLEDRPDLFTDGYVKYMLFKEKLLSPEEFPLTDVLKIYVDDLDNLVNGLNPIRSTRTRTVDGVSQQYTHFEYPIKKILEGNLDMYNDYVDVESFFQYVADKETEREIFKILQEEASKKGVTLDEDDDLYELFQEWGDNTEIENAIRLGTSIAEESDTVDEYIRRLKNNFSVYGDVKSLTDEGLEIEVDLTAPLNELDEDLVVDIIDNNYGDGGLNIEKAFWDIVNETYYYEKEKFDYEYYASPSDKEINENVRDYL